MPNSNCVEYTKKTINDAIEHIPYIDDINVNDIEKYIEYLKNIQLSKMLEKSTEERRLFYVWWSKRKKYKSSKEVPDALITEGENIVKSMEQTDKIIEGLKAELFGTHI